MAQNSDNIFSSITNNENSDVDALPNTVPDFFQSLLDDATKIFNEDLLEEFIDEILEDHDLAENLAGIPKSDDNEDSANKRAELRIELRFHCENWKKKLNGQLERQYKSSNTASNYIADLLATSAHNLCKDPTTASKERFKVLNPLLPFRPSNAVLQALESENPVMELSSKNETFGEYLKTRELNSQNIHEILKTLLEIEDVAQIREYLPLVQRSVTLRLCSTRRFACTFNESDVPANIQDILTPHLDEVLVVQSDRNPWTNASTAQSAIEALLPHVDEDLFGTVAVVKKVSKAEVEFAFDSPVQLNVEKIKYDLIFRSRRYPIRYQRTALDLLAKSPDMCVYLFPKHVAREKPFGPVHFEWVNAAVAENPEQLQAVQNIVFAPNPNAPYVVFGPPGTGKTTTIVESILQIRLQYPESRILVAAGSNSACDTIALRICDYFKSSPVLRKHLASSEVLPMLRIYSKAIQRRGVDNIPVQLLQRSNIAWNAGSHDYPSVGDIQKYGIVVVTLCTVGKLVTGEVNKNNFFTHVFIDEAAASTEAETLVGIMGIKHCMDANCRIVLSGDHKQLGPVLKSNVAGQLGFAQSMMERLLKGDCYAVDNNGNYDRLLQMRLRRNYRSHPEIVGLYNRLYYNNELLALSEDAKTNVNRHWSFIPNPKFPIGFQAVHGNTTKEGTTSSCNILEIKVIIWYLHRLVKMDGVEPKDIGIIAPYRLQCHLLQKRLEEHNMTAVDVGSVEAFQGREKEVIIVSMVRSFSYLGFLRSERRLNVILSRAKSLLLIVGNPVTLRNYKDLRFIIETCKAKGTYLYKKKVPGYKKLISDMQKNTLTTAETNKIDIVEGTHEVDTSKGMVLCRAQTSTTNKIDSTKRADANIPKATTRLDDLIKAFAIDIRRTIADIRLNVPLKMDANIKQATTLHEVQSSKAIDANIIKITKTTTNEIHFSNVEQTKTVNEEDFSKSIDVDTTQIIKVNELDSLMGRDADILKEDPLKEIDVDPTKIATTTDDIRNLKVLAIMGKKTVDEIETPKDIDVNITPIKTIIELKSPMKKDANIIETTTSYKIDTSKEIDVVNAEEISTYNELDAPDEILSDVSQAKTNENERNSLLGMYLNMQKRNTIIDEVDSAKEIHTALTAIRSPTMKDRNQSNVALERSTAAEQYSLLSSNISRRLRKLQSKKDELVTVIESKLSIHNSKRDTSAKCENKENEPNSTNVATSGNEISLLVKKFQQLKI